MTLRPIWTKNSNGAPLTFKKIAALICAKGTIIAGMLFAFGIFNHDKTQMIIFGMLALICAGVFVTNGKALKEEE